MPALLLPETQRYLVPRRGGGRKGKCRARLMRHRTRCCVSQTRILDLEDLPLPPPAGKLSGTASRAPGPIMNRKRPPSERYGDSSGITSAGDAVARVTMWSYVFSAGFPR